MARTPSTMQPLGTTAPEFTLPDVNGKNVGLSDFAEAKALLVMFICNHCPFVKHVRQGLIDLANDYKGKGVAVVAINSNDVQNYPDDSPEKMREEAEKYSYPFPYLYDETQAVARDYMAACTPDFFLYDGDLRLAYRGQLDGSRPGNDVEVTGEDMRAAVDAVLEGRPAPEKQLPSVGCNIKWRPGNEPTYA